MKFRWVSIRNSEFYVLSSGWAHWGYECVRMGNSWQAEADGLYVLLPTQAEARAWVESQYLLRNTQ